MGGAVPGGPAVTFGRAVDVDAAALVPLGRVDGRCVVATRAERFVVVETAATLHA
jgi:hypothetical protein